MGGEQTISLHFPIQLENLIKEASPHCLNWGREEEGVFMASFTTNSTYLVVQVTGYDNNEVTF